MDNTKHVVVAFRTDWCKHCSEIDKMYKNFERDLLKDNRDIILGTFDYDYNESP